MKFKINLFVALFFSLACEAQYNWQALPFAPKSWRFDDMYFTDPAHGWVINPAYNYITPNQFGRIFKTIDGGASWQMLVSNSATFFRCVGFADTTTGWVGNIADTDLNYLGVPYTTDTIALYQTNDGGTTWHPANLPHPHPAGICGISVVTDSVVYAYGRFYGPAGYVKTTDKGANWAYKDMTSQAFGLIDGKFFGPDTGFITGMGTDHKALILSTTDGGATWNPCYHSSRTDTDRVWKVVFPSRNIGFATIEYGGSNYTYNTWFLKTTDGGLNWTEHPFQATYDEEGLGFINDSVGWIGGDFDSGTYVTFDGGASWALDAGFGVLTSPYIVGPKGYYINRFRRFGDTLMYASGNTIYKLDAARLGVGAVKATIVSSSNRPNPFSEQTTITYTLPKSISGLNFEVFNMAGQRIFSQSLGQQEAGAQQLIFKRPLPSGIYIYTIKGEGFELTQRMVVER